MLRFGAPGILSPVVLVVANLSPSIPWAGNFSRLFSRTPRILDLTENAAQPYNTTRLTLAEATQVKSWEKCDGIDPLTVVPPWTDFIDVTLFIGDLHAPSSNTRKLMFSCRRDTMVSVPTRMGQHHSLIWIMVCCRWNVPCRRENERVR